MSKGRIGPVCTCEKCGRQFRSWKPRPLNRFCSSECSPHGRKAKSPSQICEKCGVLFRRSNGIRGGKWRNAKFCSRDCYLASNPRVPVSGGYVLAYAKGEPGARPNGQILEHRLIMQQHLGRPLKDSETVHHINGDRADNRIENLQLRKGKHGKGIVMICKSCGSHDVGPISISSGG